MMALQKYLIPEKLGYTFKHLITETLDTPYPETYQKLGTSANLAKQVDILISNI